VQEAFLKVWDRWDRVQGLEDPAGYLYRTAFNVWRSRTRRAVRSARYRLTGHQPDDIFERVNATLDLRRTLQGMPERQRAALVLVHLLGYSSAEAGRLMGVRPETIRSLASQGRAALRSSLGGTDG
jgi:RNA polymerase sigma factor (sigma-70 family)